MAFSFSLPSMTGSSYSVPLRMMRAVSLIAKAGIYGFFRRRLRKSVSAESSANIQECGSTAVILLRGVR
jgi:hypothetical protein